MKDSGSKSDGVSFDVPTLSRGGFSATWMLSSTSVIVRLSGSADSEIAPALGGFLERLHAETVRANGKEVVLDFRELNFLTSSCIKYLVVAINRLAASPAESRYLLRLVSSPAMRWQARSFEVLRQIAPGLVQIDRE